MNSNTALETRNAGPRPGCYRRLGRRSPVWKRIPVLEGRLAELREKEGRFRMLCCHVDEFEISSRARNRLVGNGVRYMHELVCKDDAALLRMRGFGGKCLREVKESLSACGLGLGMKLDGEFYRYLRTRHPG